MEGFVFLCIEDVCEDVWRIEEGCVELVDVFVIVDECFGMKIIDYFVVVDWFVVGLGIDVFYEFEFGFVYGVFLIVLGSLFFFFRLIVW